MMACAERDLPQQERNRLQLLLKRERMDIQQRGEGILKHEKFVWEGTYTPTKSLRQEGPMCGITALCMSMSMSNLGINQKLTEGMDVEVSPTAGVSKDNIHLNRVERREDDAAAYKVVVEKLPRFHKPNCGKDDPVAPHKRTSLDLASYNLLKYAIFQGITTYGEIFSSESLADLAMNYYNTNAKYVKHWTFTELTRHLCSGKLALVPYDSDFNHTPCCKRGHKAHWALLTGVVYTKTKSADKDTFNKASTDDIMHGETPIPEVCSLQDDLINVRINARASPKATQTSTSSTGDVTTSEDDSKADSKRPSSIEPANTYVLARHGKSSHLTMWSLIALHDSNAQLTSMDPTISSDITQRYPPVSEGLCSSMVLLY